MNQTTQLALYIAQGPLFRFAIALTLLGLIRVALLGLSDVAAAFVTDADRGVFRRKINLRLTWAFFPSVVINRVRPFLSGPLYAYHLVLDAASLYFRASVVLLPIFLVAHVYLWERALAISWPALPGQVADVLSIAALVSGGIVFLGRIYSPTLRSIEPAASFFKPLLLLLPYFTGILTRHPTWSPLDFHFVLLIHALSASLVLTLLPFARLLSGMHTRLTTLAPDVTWRAEAPTTTGPQPAAARSH